MTYHPNLNPWSAKDYVQSVIIGTLVTDLLAAGYLIDVEDQCNGERDLEASNDRLAILKAVFDPAIDSDTYRLVCYPADRNSKQPRGNVLLIDGNGVDVISDYHTCIEPVLARACAIANKIDAVGAERWVMERLTAIEAVAGKAAKALWDMDEPDPKVRGALLAELATTLTVEG